MTLDEFKSRHEKDDEWAPGWDAIDDALGKLYPGQKEEHFATDMQSRAMFGGDQYLDGYSVYTSTDGYKHIVTYGMTELYYDEQMFGGEWNKWGYEMTFKLAETETENCKWALNMLANLARYTYTSKRFFEPLQTIAGNGSSICLDRDSKITALLTVADTELEGAVSVYGKTDFIQLVGITESELTALREDRITPDELVERMRKQNPKLVTDLNRSESYL